MEKNYKGIEVHYAIKTGVKYPFVKIANKEEIPKLIKKYISLYRKVTSELSDLVDIAVREDVYFNYRRYKCLVKKENDLHEIICALQNTIKKTNFVFHDDLRLEQNFDQEQIINNLKKLRELRRLREYELSNENSLGYYDLF